MKQAALWFMVTLAIAVGTVFAFGQDTPPTAEPIEFKCTSTIPNGLSIIVNWDRTPFEQLNFNMAAVHVVSSDVTPPVISDVLVTVVNITKSVMDNKQLILAASKGVPFTVKASDDVSLTYARLYVDGEAATTIGEQDGLPALFYLRWNARVVNVGIHDFQLKVWDAAGNVASKIWTMRL